VETEDHERPDQDGRPGEEAALPLRRQDIQEGLRTVHEMLTAAQEERIQAVAHARALAFILIEKGILMPHELASGSSITWSKSPDRNP
jgi:hypothetical protein